MLSDSANWTDKDKNARLFFFSVLFERFFKTFVVELNPTNGEIKGELLGGFLIRHHAALAGTCMLTDPDGRTGW